MSRRGGHDDGGAHGGSWKIALADLMTVLMVFFLVMWLLAVVEPEKRKTFAESLTGKYEEPVAVVEDSAKQDGSELNPLDLKPPATELEIRQSLKTMNQRDIEIEDGPEFTRITLKSDSFFESGRATISDKTREQLETLGETLAGRGQKMVISGYTDDIPINNFQFPSNWELSAARAATVARTFIYMGVDQSLIKIEGNADNDPVVPNDSSYSRSVNRRVIITVDKRPPVEVKKPLPTPVRAAR
ncbi:OmpA/MotB family protein [Thiomicrorhabdus cannonii]|uniref:OmpA/MotB family protein n=1 Tax=Thiomicrorhabdus cannonii TaxID=2748011 RepID=UPI0015B947F2|nr:flagellar motor protein MotB [Thiomicrorhabdus cannonii]